MNAILLQLKQLHLCEVPRVRGPCRSPPQYQAEFYAAQHTATGVFHLKFAESVSAGSLLHQREAACRDTDSQVYP